MRRGLQPIGRREGREDDDDDDDDDHDEGGEDELKAEEQEDVPLNALSKFGVHRITQPIRRDRLSALYASPATAP